MLLLDFLPRLVAGRVLGESEGSGKGCDMSEGKAESWAACTTCSAADRPAVGRAANRSEGET